MINKRGFEKGQAIVLIAVALVALFALIALGLDGGHAYSDRRQAQNASDAAALSVARRYAQDQTTTSAEWTTIAQTVAATNGYDYNDPGRSTVELQYRTATPAECPGYVAPPNAYVFQVDVDSTMPTWFGPVIGVSQVHNHVTSYALSCPPMRTIAYNGNAIVALNKHACKALEFGGSASITVTSSVTPPQGLFVNSDCFDQNGVDGTQNALYAGGSGQVIAPSVNVVGGVYHRDYFLPTLVNTRVPPMIKEYYWPPADDLCPVTTPTSTVVGSTLTPGKFPGSNSSWASKSFPPAGIDTLQAGIYCVSRPLSLSGGDQLTGTDVTIVQLSGDIGITGGDINLAAPQSGPYQGLLLYQPRGNATAGSVAGGGNSSYNGSIVAPDAHITINGGSATNGPFQTQVIADTIQINGSGVLTVNFDGNSQYQPPTQAFVQLLK